MHEIYTITQVAKTYGISTRTLRYYEQIGLISSKRMEGYAYRVYDKETCAQLNQILILRKLRIPLKQIASMLIDNSVIGALGMFMQHIHDIDEEITTLSTIRSILQTFSNKLRENPNIRLNTSMLNDEHLLSIFAPLSLIKNKFKEEKFMTDKHENDKPLNDVISKPLTVDPILLLFGYGLIPLVDENQGGSLLKRIVLIRQYITAEKGTVIPIVRLRDDEKLNPEQYTISIKNKEIARGEIMMGYYMAVPSKENANINEIDGIKTIDPCLGIPSFWILESQCEQAKELGYTVLEPAAVIAAHLTETILSHLHILLTLQDVHKLVENVKEDNPILIDELIPKYLSLNHVKQILSELLKEGASICDMVTILETLLDYTPTTQDIKKLTVYVQQNLS